VEDRRLDGVVDSEAACDFADTVVLRLPRFTPSSIDNVVDVSSSSAAETEAT